MIRSLSLAFAQVFDRPFRRVLWKGLGGTVVLYILAYLGIGWAVSHLSWFGVAWEDFAANLLGGLAVFAVTLVLFPSIASLVISVLLDDVAEAVEQRHYPTLPVGRQQGFREVAVATLRLAAVTLGINILVLPFYLLLLVFGIGVVLYYAVNGYLLSREYFELAAGRRLTPDAASALRRAHLGRLWLLGVIIAIISTVPIVNLLAPLVATAAMVHETVALTGKHPGLRNGGVVG